MKYIKTFEKVSKEDPFLAAAKRGSASTIQKMIKDGYDKNIKDKQSGRTALMLATLNRYIAVMNVLIDAGADVNIQDNGGRTALAMSSTRKSIDALLKAGADVNQQAYDGRNAIMEYLNYENDSEKYIKLLEMFIDYGLDLDIKNNKGENLYDIIKNEQKRHTIKSNKYDYYIEVEKYLNEKYPQYKEEWEIKNNMDKYNL
jgi:ankyrin repeat protein